MFINSIILAISSSIDSLGIGITYGIKNTNISYFGKVILFIISFIVTSLSILFGNIIKNILSEHITNFIGSAILFFLGIFICFQAFKKNVSYDLDNSNSIDFKEAIFLGLALSMDSFCIGIGGSIIGINPYFFPLLISAFQFIFLSIGNFLGKKLYYFSSLPDCVWSLLSGILLILISLIKLICKKGN